MARYDVERPIPLSHQMGDTGDIAFVIPDILPITNWVVSFFVKDGSANTVIIKSSGNVNQITKTGQTIAIRLDSIDTQNKAGIWHWELRLTLGTERITIGYGTLKIKKLV